MNKVEMKVGEGKLTYEFPEDVGLMQIGSVVHKIKNAITPNDCDATVYIKDKKYIVTLTKNGLVRKG
jgi:hypothetical protein